MSHDVRWVQIFHDQTYNANELHLMDIEKAKRDANFANPAARKQVLSGFKNASDFEVAALDVNGLQESGATRAADLAYRIDGLLDEILKEIEIYI